MADNKKNSCETHLSEAEKYEPIQPLKASGNAPVLVEIICERVHCVLYDYAINTVDIIVEIFGDLYDYLLVLFSGGLGC